jgi:hypothetical protein
MILRLFWQSKFGYGNAVYQGANRYYLNNFFMQQHKLEIKGKLFVRGYTTTEDGGNSYDMLLLVLILIEFGKMTKPGLVSMQQRMLVLL